MWIKRLEVSDWAGIAAAAIDLEPGLNVLHGPNELGKSSLVNAVRAALLLQSTSSAAAPLRDWHADAPPRVALTFEQEAQRVWRVRKSFGSSGHAYLEFSRDGSEFTQEGKGREVDGTLRRILRWGLKGPGLPGGKHGMAASFITTALLGEQSDVVAILRTSLAGDGDDSGRERLSEALQALAEDPRFKRVLAAVQEKVDEAFTGSGKKRTGQASPWAQIRGQRVAAEASERDVRQQLEESESARVRTERLHEQLLAAEAKRQGADRVLAELDAALERRKARGAAETALAAAEAECSRVQGLFDRRDRNAAALADGAERVSELDRARAAAEAAAESRKLQVEATREQVRRLETGAGEQQRRLREEEAKNRRLELERSQQDHEQKVAVAEALARREEEITALAADVDKRETELKESEGLLRDARVAAARGRDEIGALELERQCARYLGAVGAARASAAALDAAREHARQAAELERRAVATREEAADLHAPARAELDRLRSLETAWRLAREKLAVGLAVEVALERGATAEISIDGQSRQVRIEGGEPAALEAQRELRLDLAGIGVVHVRGGGRDLLRDAAAAEDDWNREAPPVFARAGCATLPALEALRTRADGLLETASGLERQAEQERARAEGLDELERRAVVAKAEVEQRRAALAEGLNAGESVEEYVDGLDEPPRDETSIEQGIARLEAEGREREEHRQQLEHTVAAEEREVTSRRRDLAEKQAEQRSRAQEAGDWRQVLAGASAERDRLRREIEAVDAELAKIRVEATTEVEQARRALAELDGEENRSRETLRETTERWTTARDELARLEGEAAELRATTRDEDHDAVRVLRDRCRADLDALPAPTVEVDPERLPGAKDAATAAAADVRQLEMQLRAAEGALEQVGGQYIQERARQAREAVAALEEREHELDLDHGAWRLLQEALLEHDVDAGPARSGGVPHPGGRDDLPPGALRRRERAPPRGGPVELRAATHGCRNPTCRWLTAGACPSAGNVLGRVSHVEVSNRAGRHHPRRSRWASSGS